MCSSRACVELISRDRAQRDIDLDAHGAKGLDARDLLLDCVAPAVGPSKSRNVSASGALDGSAGAAAGVGIMEKTAAWYTLRILEAKSSAFESMPK
jgi:hypothetical protein